MAPDKIARGFHTRQMLVEEAKKPVAPITVRLSGTRNSRSPVLLKLHLNQPIGNVTSSFLV